MEVAVWIARRSQPFSVTELRRSLEVALERSLANSTVDKDVKKLLGAGLLERLALEGTEVFYQRKDSVYFRLCVDLATEWERRGGPYFALIDRPRVAAGQLALFG
jgi:DNA-binding transcriptional ArsR family regulator